MNLALQIFTYETYKKVKNATLDRNSINYAPLSAVRKPNARPS